MQELLAWGVDHTPKFPYIRLEHLATQPKLCHEYLKSHHRNKQSFEKLFPEYNERSLPSLSLERLKQNHSENKERSFEKQRGEEPLQEFLQQEGYAYSAKAAINNHSRLVREGSSLILEAKKRKER